MSREGKGWRELAVEGYAAHIEGERQIRQNVRDLIPRDPTHSALRTVRMQIDEMPLTVAQVYSRANRDQNIEPNPQMAPNEPEGIPRNIVFIQSSDPTQVQAIQETGLLPENAVVVGWVPITIAQVNRRDDMPAHWTENPEEFPEPYEQEIESWKVIGWTEEEQNFTRIVLFKHSDIETLQSSVFYYTDSVFPVLGLPEIIRVDPNNTEIEDITPLPTIADKSYFHSLILSQYRTGIHLVLVKTNVKPEERMVGLAERGDHSIRSQSAELWVIIPIQENNSIYVLGTVDRIFSIYHTNKYPFIGLFAGHQFDEHMFANENFPKLSEDLTEEDPFIWEYRQFGIRLSQRVGYLVSNDSLLGVCESWAPIEGSVMNRINRSTNTLLKEGTFLVIEGKDNFNYQYNKVRAMRKILPIVTKNSLSNIPYPPKIVVIGEGMNGMNIYWGETPLVLSLRRYRISKLHISDPTLYPSVIDWQQFRRDFQNVLPIPEIEFRQIVSKDEINDYIEIIGYQITRAECHLVLSLYRKSYPTPNHSQLYDYWHLYLSIGQTNDFIYIMSFNVCSQIQRRVGRGPQNRQVIYYEQYYTTRISQSFGNAITDAYHPEYQTQVYQHWFADAHYHFNRQQQRYNKGFALLLRTVSGAQPQQFKNPGLYTELRFRLFEELQATYQEIAPNKFEIL